MEGADEERLKLDPLKSLQRLFQSVSIISIFYVGLCVCVCVYVCMCLSLFVQDCSWHLGPYSGAPDGFSVHNMQETASYGDHQLHTVQPPF